MNSKALHIYNASAGSGKTYTLVQEYLSIVLRDSNPLKFTKVLAMTFTNKAANEMKVRIVDRLMLLSKPPQEAGEEEREAVQQTAKWLGISAAQVEVRSRQTRDAILHHYGLFAVMTIDKFTHKIIRTFAHDLGFSLDFDIEMDTKTLRRRATDSLFEQIGSRCASLTNLMMEYALTNLRADKSWNFKQQLFDFSELLLKEDALTAIRHFTQLTDREFIDKKTELEQWCQEFEQTLQKPAKEAVALIASHHLEEEDFQGKSKNGAASYFKKIASDQWLRSSDKLTPPSNPLTEYVANDKWAHPKSDRKAATEAIASELKGFFCQIKEKIDVDYGTYILYREILNNIGQLSLMGHLLRAIEELKTHDNVLLIGDFYKKIAAVISREPVPFIYERMGMRYDHFLLDEFQDTSHLQWVSLVPLIHHSLAQKKANLMVGDGKQAIYRWRNGEVEQFNSLPDRLYNPENSASLSEAEPTFKREGERITLKENWRSSPEIVQFNNAFFRFASEKSGELIAAIYKGEQTPKRHIAGCVEFQLSEEWEEESRHIYTLNTIEKAIESGFERQAICVLVRTNKNGAAIAQYLEKQGHKVVSQDSLLVGKDTQVKFLIHLMAALAFPENPNVKLKCIEHYRIIFPAEEGVNWWEEGRRSGSIQQFMEDQGYSLPTPDQFHSFYRFAEHLLEVFALQWRESPYLQQLLEQTHQFEKKQGANMLDFLSWFDEKGREAAVAYPEGIDAIRVMTIHKAKGLEFPIVICPYLDWDTHRAKSTIWIADREAPLAYYFLRSSKKTKMTKHEALMEEEDAKQRMDHLNLVYVAFTRAKVALFACGGTKKANTPISNWLFPYLTERAAEQGFTEEEGCFRKGKLTVHKSEPSPAVHTFSLATSWEQLPSDRLSLARAEEFPFEDTDERRKRGTELHAILATIEGQSDVVPTIRRLEKKGVISSEYSADYEAAIAALFEDDHFKSYFTSGRIRNEAAIVDLDGKKHIPDKLIEQQEGALVVEFKTGREKTQEHYHQLKGYLELLRQMGYAHVRGELYYTTDQTVTSVKG